MLIIEFFEPGCKPKHRLSSAPSGRCTRGRHGVEMARSHATEWRLEAFRRWKTMTEPAWAKVHYPKIDFQNLYCYSAPKSAEGPKSLAEVDPELLPIIETTPV